MVILFIVSLLFSKVLTYISIKALPKLGFIDHPRDLHIHVNAIPNAGGISLILAFFLTYLVQYIFSILLNIDFCCFHSSCLVNVIIMPVTILGVMGLLDDRYELNNIIKLLIEVTVAYWCWKEGLRITYLFSFELPSYLSLGATILWIVAFINAFNMIDGMDGLAAGLGFISSMCMGIVFIIHSGVAYESVIAFVIAGVCLGFLRYNFCPAKIYMGDTGSMFIGFMISVIGLAYCSKAIAVSSVFIPIFAAGIPVMDITLAVWRRGIKKLLKISKNRIPLNSHVKVNFTSRDLEHLHHREYFHNNSHIKTVMNLYNLGIIGSLISIICAILYDQIDGILVLIIIMIISVIIVINAKYELKITKAYIKALSRKQNLEFRKYILLIFIDYLALLLVFLVVKLIFQMPHINMKEMLICVGPYIAVNFIVRFKLASYDNGDPSFFVNCVKLRIKFFLVALLISTIILLALE